MARISTESAFTLTIKERSAATETEITVLTNSGGAKAQPVIARRSPQLYPVVWRWHFYAGLLTVPILLLIIVTGSLYVFRTEVTAWRDRALQVVEPQTERLSYDQLREIAVRELAPHEPEGLVVHPEAHRSIRFVAHAHEGDDHSPNQQHRRLYLNPYDGKVLGTRIEEEDFFAIVLQLHRSLMLGTTGRVISELVTSWCIILLATGLYLWWPRGKSNVGVWLPRIRGKLYAVLRDWHAVAGFYVLPFAVLVTVTGMFFTTVWGNAYNNTAKSAGQWPKKWFGMPKSTPPTPESQPTPLDGVVNLMLTKSRPGDSVMIKLAEKPTEGHRAFMMRDEDKNSLRMVTVDQYSGALIDVIDVAELPLMFRIRVWAVSIHMGQIFGTPTKILALLTTIVMVALSITGIWMWWHRRPAGATGFPRRPQPRSLPVWGWGIVVLTGVLMPVAGASIVIMALVDRLVLLLRSRSRMAT